MQAGMSYQRYTGTAPMMPNGPWRGAMGGPGHCRHCGQPSAACHCGCRECRKEAKELVVTAVPRDPQNPGGVQPGGSPEIRMLQALMPEAAAAEASPATATGFIGGGCCVTLAVEYAASVATAPLMIIVVVKDSEGTILAWSRTEPAGTPYRVHECIITTKPGATLTVLVANGTARVRWCEVFSCC